MMFILSLLIGKLPGRCPERRQPESPDTIAVKRSPRELTQKKGSAFASKLWDHVRAWGSQPHVMGGFTNTDDCHFRVCHGSTIIPPVSYKYSTRSRSFKSRLSCYSSPLPLPQVRSSLSQVKNWRDLVQHVCKNTSSAFYNVQVADFFHHKTTPAWLVWNFCAAGCHSSASLSWALLPFRWDL